MAQLVPDTAVVVPAGNNWVMTDADHAPDQGSTFRHFRYDATGLAGRRMRVVAEYPEDDSGRDSDLPPGTKDVIAVDDTPSVFLEMRVHPVDMPERLASVRFDQLALYIEE